MSINTQRSLNALNKGIFYNADSIPRCSKDMQHLLKYASIFCTKAETYMDLYTQIEFMLVIWVWVILSCYDSIEYSSNTLRMNSCNASFVFMSGTLPNGDKEKLIAKFQMDPTADDINVDNINGYIVNRIASMHPAVKPFFMEYIDSCLTYLNTKKQIYDLEMLLNMKESSDYEIEDTLQKLKSQSDLVKVSFNKVVNKPTSLGDLLSNLNSRRKSNNNNINSHAPKLSAKDIVSRLRPLIEAIKTMGSKYGFTHNDAHLGNILHDGEQDHFVLIDFGRVLFVQDLLPSELQEDVKDRIFQERFKTSEQVVAPGLEDYSFDYDNLCMNSNESMSRSLDYTNYIYYKPNFEGVGLLYFLANNPNITEDVKKHLYMFDVMTISMNVVKSLYTSKNYGTLAKYIYFDENVVYINVLKPKNFAKLLLKGTDKEYIHLLMGCYWFSLFIEHIGEVVYRANLTIADNDDWFYIHISGLYDNLNIFFRRFQVITFPEVDKFVDKFMEHREDIAQITGMLPLSGGSSKKGNLHKKTNRKRSLKMQVQKASAKEFRKEAAAYSLKQGGSEVELCERVPKRPQNVNANAKPLKFKAVPQDAIVSDDVPLRL